MAVFVQYTAHQGRPKGAERRFRLGPTPSPRSLINSASPSGRVLGRSTSRPSPAKDPSDLARTLHLWYHGTIKLDGIEDTAIAVSRGGADTDTGSESQTDLEGALEPQMSRVKFMELETNSKLRALEKKITAALGNKGYPGLSVRLFQDQAGKIGYSAQVVASTGGKKALDLIHRLVGDLTGYKRGPPPSRPARQVNGRTAVSP